MTRPRVLLSAASRHGATTGIAQALAGTLGERGYEVSVQPPESVTSLDGFPVVILGSAVYLGHWLAPATRLIDRFVNELASRSVYVFSSGPVGDPPFPAGPASDLGDVLDRTGARDHATFAGSLVKSELGAGERIAVRMSRVAYGDARDWTAIAAWATAIADDLAAPARRPSTWPAVAKGA